MGMSAAHCQGNVREFQSVWRVVTLIIIVLIKVVAIDSVYCLSQSRTWRYKLAENSYFVAGVCVYWNPQQNKLFCCIFLVFYFISLCTC